MIDISALIFALKNNGIKECFCFGEDSFSVGWMKFYLDGDWLKNDREKWILDDIRSVLNILMYEGLLRKDIALTRRILTDYKLMAS